MDPSEQNDMQILLGARYTMEAMSTLMSRISISCFNKCVKKFNEPDLFVGEMTCVDRCVLKFLAVQQSVADKVNSNQRAQVEQMQQMQQQ